MAKLELFLLGSPQIVVDGQAITNFNTRKDQALLAYLAVTGAAHSRETLAGLLWSELPEDKARRNLRHALSHLQKAIGSQWLELERGVALTQEQPWSVDIHTLRSTVKSLMTPAHLTVGQNDTQLLAALDQVLQLYRGEFLQGFYLREAVHFEEWVVAQREELRLLTLRGLELLVERCLAQGAYEQGLAATRRLLQLEPWSEPAHCLQMQLLAQSGRRADALAQYETCRQILATELDVEPLPTTTALYQQIKRGQYNPPLNNPPLATNLPASSVGLAPKLPAHQETVAIKPTIPHNLLAPLAGFVGRQAELDLICQRLTTAACRLLTIVGPGGMGKTSLAHAVGQHLLTAEPNVFPDGLYFVPLLDVGAAGWERAEPAADPVYGEAILRAMAAQLGYKLEGGRSPAVQLEAYLGTRRLLFILDNFEHLLAGTDAVVTLLSKAPGVKALITSRARLHVRGETVLTLDKLSLPSVAYQASVAAQTDSTSPIRPEVWQSSEAVAMFVQRAEQGDPFFTVTAATLAPITQICQLVEGLPLGIELATSMLPLLNCTQLAAELARSLDFLAADTWDLPPTQRTLGAVFERSWSLLPAEGQQLLARLSIFPGSFRRDAAEQIAGAALLPLRCLLDQSLVNKAGDDRYVLHRTVLAFAQQKLQQWPEQNAPLHEQYAHFYLAYLARLKHEQSAEAYATVTKAIETDLDNVRTAWRWSVDQGNVALLELGLESLQEFYRLAGIYPEAIQLLEAALPTVRQAVALAADGRDVSGTDARRLLARLLCYTVQFYRLYRQLGQGKKAESLANEALELGRQLADPALQAVAYHELARLAQTRVDFAAMRLLAEQACIYGRQANLPELIAENLNDLGIADGVYTHPLASIQHFHEALACLQQHPNRGLEARIVSNLGMFHLMGHEYQAAYHHLQQRRALQPLNQERMNSLITLVNFGDLWLALGAYSAAQQEYEQAQALLQGWQGAYWESWLHVGYGRLQRLCGELTAALATCRLAVQVAQKDGGRTEQQWAQIELGHVLADLGDFVAASACYRQAIALPTEINWFFRTPDAHAGLAALALAQNQIKAAIPHAESALALLTQQGIAAAGEPFAVYWTCVRVLQAAGDPRVESVLATAYQALQVIANQLADVHLRRSFLEKVVVNRKLMAAAQAADTSR